MNPPTAATAATAEPEIAPNSMPATMFTEASPPGSIPTTPRARSTSRRAMPPRFINWPERIKNGIARSVKRANPAATR